MYKIVLQDIAFQSISCQQCRKIQVVISSSNGFRTSNQGMVAIDGYGLSCKFADVALVKETKVLFIVCPSHIDS